MQAVIVISARFQSVRFPGKPLVPLNGKTLIQRCYESASKVPGIDATFVATDDARIGDHVEGFGGRALMTPESCGNGTERCAAVVSLLKDKPEIVVNWQGDSPLINGSYVQSIVRELRESPDADVATPVIRCSAELFRRLKVDRKAGRVGGTLAVVTRSLRALYFSKELIPYSDRVTEAQHEEFYYHVGMYGYRASTLERYLSWPPGPLERIEALDQLRFLENDRTVKAVVVEGKGHWEVNNPEDVPLVEQLLREHGIP